MQNLPSALVLEDDPDIRSMFKTMLMVLGYDATVASSVGEAESFINNGLPVPEVALLDYHLPDGKGPQVARMLRERFGNQVRIISASARWGPQERWDPKERELYDVILLKPFTLAELKKALKNPDSP